MSATNQTIPEEQCEWCGGFIKYVRILGKTNPKGEPLVVPIDSEPLAFDDWRGKLFRVPPKFADGRIDVAQEVPDSERWQYARSYSYHRDTCTEADKWTGQKKWSPPRGPRIQV